MLPSALPGTTATPSNKGLSTGAKIAIGVVVPIVVLLIAALLVFWFCVYKKKKHDQKSPPHFVGDYDAGGHEKADPPNLINDNDIYSANGKHGQGYYAPQHDMTTDAAAASPRPQTTHSFDSRGGTLTPATVNSDRTPVPSSIRQMASVPHIRGSNNQDAVRSVETVPEIN